MAKIGLFFGSTTGKTADVAETIQKVLGGEAVVTLHDIADAEAGDFDSYEYLIIACPTWDIGELQADWDGFFPELDDIDFSGKTVSYFATGDQVGYSDNFMDAMGTLEAKISARGGKTVGYWPVTDDYDFNASTAVKNGKFVGLALDEDNQSELTEGRINAWVAQLKAEISL
ncbi:MAG: flavodoxin FldA [Cyanothece sp. SIO1E1]|nr:flavodoxin FldA [Cyanothece sp. SIO1E1]